MTAAPEVTAVRRFYGGWQNDRSTALLGLSLPRLLLVLSGVVAMMSWLLVDEHAITLPIHAGLAVVMVALAFVRIVGRTADEWIVTAFAFASGRLRGRHRFLSGPFAPAAGRLQDRDGSPPGKASGRPVADLPGVLASLRFVEAELATAGLGGGTANGTPVCVLHPYDRTATIVAKVRTPGLLAADAPTQARRVNSWAHFLAARCVERSPVVRIQAVVRSIPDDGQALIRWATDHLDRSAPPDAVASYDALLAGSAGASFAYDSFLAITVDLRRARADVTEAGGGDLGTAAAVLRQQRVFAAEIAGAGLGLERWLDGRELAEVLRVAYDPASAAGLSRRRHDPAQRSGVDVAHAGPVAAEAAWGCYRHDSGFSATYVVEEWPASPVGATTLAALLMAAGGTAQHRVALTIEPLAPRRADQIVGADRTGRSAELSMRLRIGQVIPERAKALLRNADQQDAELAAGHGLCRYVAYVTVTESSADRLEAACADLESASSAKVGLRRLWGVQDVGFAATLPLGLGLPNRRGVL